MASAKKQRRRKYKGTQAGSIDRSGQRRSRPRTRAEAKARAVESRGTRKQRVPSLKGAATRAGIAAGFFVVLVTLILHQKPLPSLILGLVAFLIYVPLGYWVDKWVYNRNQRRQADAGAAKPSSSPKPPESSSSDGVDGG